MTSPRSIAEARCVAGMAYQDRVRAVTALQAEVDRLHAENAALLARLEAAGSSHV